MAELAVRELARTRQCCREVNRRGGPFDPNEDVCVDRQSHALVSAGNSERIRRTSSENFSESSANRGRLRKKSANLSAVNGDVGIAGTSRAITLSSRSRSTEMPSACTLFTKLAKSRSASVTFMPPPRFRKGPYSILADGCAKRAGHRRA